jgi:hypothetical protein
MPIPTFNKLPPDPSFNDLVTRINQLVGEMTNLILNLDSLNVVSLTADHIDAGTIDANVVTLRSDLNAGAYIQIDGNGMVINNGTFDTFTADINGAMTMTRALIQSTPGAYPRVVMDPTDELFAAYATANDFLKIYALESGTPMVYFSNLSSIARLFLNGSNLSLANFGTLLMTASSHITVETTGASADVNLIPGAGSGTVRVPSWSKIYSNGAAQNLQTALNAKANAFSGVSGTVYVASTSGGATTTPITFSNGIRVS